MAGQRPYRVTLPRKNEATGKTYWTQIGVAFKRDTGAFSVMLDALPMPTMSRDGKNVVCEMMIFPPDDNPRADSGARQPAKQDDDDIAY